MNSRPAIAARSLAVWFIIMACETVHGIIRIQWLQPRLGDLRARQVCLFTGAAIILAVTVVFIRWMRVETVRQKLAVGLFWVVLTFGFEIGMGVLQGFSAERIFSDYDLARGGLMGFGLLFMAFVPWLAARLRGEKTARK